MTTFRTFVLVAASVIGLTGFAETASASSFASAHPRRAEVNHRINHQVNRIGHALASGQIGAAKAVRLLHKERQIRREERVMASLNGGHITRAEQRALNQQENRLSKRIP